ncbi:glucosaminidase [Psychromonas sp. RZ22]|uniref:glucosaminidase domain-containing protein n=1 Tax=Psychromonas algarum TaxID=2555643 RepID=UPI0010674CAC|nr:glucosaminidase domain-containing protein [Psychromonas sp. RZ22]TEW55012.1 glucosaminidase [Psychromonas sp. RZ22]
MKKLLITLFCSVLFLSACSDMHSSDEVKVHNVDDLTQLFARLHYTHDDWQKGVKKVPRLTSEGVMPDWKKLSDKMPVENKKSIFLRMMLPSVLIANENILQERKVVKKSSLDSSELMAIAIKYKVVSDDSKALTKADKQTLLKRVNIIPPSLALAQAAEESAWGTSRFAREGNAFFGQWDFSGNGMKPKQQRKHLGDYGVASFDSPLASVEGYMLNINSTSAYKSLRDLRAQQVAKNKSFSGTLLAGTLIKYSERGQDYITGLRHLISYNKLEWTDKTSLSDNKMVYIVY